MCLKSLDSNPLNYYFWNEVNIPSEREEELIEK